MDKETLSNYGWIVICVLVLAVMIALATPFGNFIANAVKSTTAGLFNTSKTALNSTGLISITDQSFDTDVVPEIPDEVEPEPEPEPIVTKAVRNERTLEEFDTVSEALNKAQAGDVIKLYKNVFESTTITAMNNTIDINGNIFSCNNIIASKLLDAKDGTGLIITPQIIYMNDGDKGDMPLKVSENQYKLFKYEFEHTKAEQTKNGSVLHIDFYINLIFSNKEAYNLLSKMTETKAKVSLDGATNGLSSFGTSLNAFGSENKDGNGTGVLIINYINTENVPTGKTIKYVCSILHDGRPFVSTEEITITAK